MSIAPVRVLIVTGIYPPDIGGPATHAADLMEELQARDWAVHVVTLKDGSRGERTSSVTRFPRAWPLPLRVAAVAGWMVRNRHTYDVVYATGLQVDAVTGARLARRPVVVKVVGDPVWDRARRIGATLAPFDEFRDAPVSASIAALRRMYHEAIRRADAITTPSDYLADTVRHWLREPNRRIEVISNGVRLGEVQPKVSAGGPPLKAVFVGRLVSHKRVEVLIEAMAQVQGTVLHIVGEGPERAMLERTASERQVSDRVRFLGSLPLDRTLLEVAEADVMVTASAYEGLPHVLIEALACATPIVAPPVGGIIEVVKDGHNGLLLQDPSPERFAAALDRLVRDPAGLAALSRNALADAENWRFERTVERLQALLAGVEGRDR